MLSDMTNINYMARYSYEMLLSDITFISKNPAFLIRYFIVLLILKVSDGLRSSFMTLAGVGMMFYMSPELAAVGLGLY